jgi:hypothetical protein
MSDLMHRQLEDLGKMTTSDLVQRYEDLHGHKCRTRHRAYLIRKIAWRIQANAEGGLSERARKRAATAAPARPVRARAPAAPSSRWRWAKVHRRSSRAASRACHRRSGSRVAWAVSAAASRRRQRRDSEGHLHGGSQRDSRQAASHRVAARVAPPQTMHPEWDVVTLTLDTKPPIMNYDQWQ